MGETLTLQGVWEGVGETLTLQGVWEGVGETLTLQGVWEGVGEALRPIPCRECERVWVRPLPCRECERVWVRPLPCRECERVWVRLWDPYLPGSVRGCGRGSGCRCSPPGCAAGSPSATARPTSRAIAPAAGSWGNTCYPGSPGRDISLQTQTQRAEYASLVRLIQCNGSFTLTETDSSMDLMATLHCAEHFTLLRFGSLIDVSVLDRPFPNEP